MNLVPEPPVISARDEGALASYLAAIRSHPWVVALVTLAAVGASAAFLATRTAKYAATADLLVNPLPQDDQTFRGMPGLVRETGDPVRTVQTAASLVEENRGAADRSASKLGDGWTGPKVLGAVSVQPRGQSNVLGVTATTTNAQDSAKVANGFVDSVLAVRNNQIISLARTRILGINARLGALPADSTAAADLLASKDELQSVVQEGDPTLAKSQQALAPSGSTGVSKALVLAVAILAGLALGSGAALLLELFARRIRDEDEALAMYPLPVLARIPVLPERRLRGPHGSTWYMPPEVREPFRTLALQLDDRGVVMVTSATTGDGKTTTAVNLAVSLAATGKSVVLLDFDLRKPQVGTALGLDHGYPVAKLVGQDTSLEPLLQTASHLGSLRVLALVAQPEVPELIEAVGFSLPELLTEARRLADYVVVDTAPLGEVGDALRLVNDVEDILVVIRPKNTAQSHLVLLRDLLERTGRQPSGYIVLSRAEGPPRGYYTYGYAQPTAANATWPSNDRGREGARETQHSTSIDGES